MPRILLRRLASLACAVPVILAACDEDTTGPPTQQAIVFLHATWPDTILATTPWSLRAFVYLGSDGCWQFQEAGIDRDGTRLIARGTSRFESPPPAACPTVLAQEWVTITGPVLPPGEYMLEGGDLRDTLIVRQQADALGDRLMAFGRFWLDNATWRFTSEAFEQYQVSNPEIVPYPGRVRLYGYVQGRESNSVLVRRFEYESSVRVPEPTKVPVADVPPDSDRIYYAEWCGRVDEVREAQAFLAQLLGDGFAVGRAWFPVGCSPCECVTCTAGIVLELDAPDARIATYGFVADTANWVFNCGIQEMWRFNIPP